MRMYIEVVAETSFKCKKGHFHVMDTEDLIADLETGEYSITFAPDVCNYCEDECAKCEHLKERERVNMSDMKDLKIELDREKEEDQLEHYRDIWNNGGLRKCIVYVDCQKEKLRVERILKDSEGVK